jgi:hypothetical protein
MIRDTPASAPQWHIVIDAIFQINQAFSRIYTVAASAAIILWSASALRNGGLGRGLATYGVIASSLLIVGIVIGHLKLDVHGMSVVVLVQVIWLIGAGIQLRKDATPMIYAAS